jgi:hypothetical protein
MQTLRRSNKVPAKMLVWEAAMLAGATGHDSLPCAAAILEAILMAEKLITSFLCECGSPHFFLLQMENDLYLLCRKCGATLELESARAELLSAKKELKKCGSISG